MEMETNTSHNLTPDMDLHTFYKTISAKGKEVIKEKKAHGETMHLAPLGYKNVRDEHGRSTVVIDPETYPLVTEAKEMRKQGVILQEICDVMKEKGLRSKRGKVIGLSSMVKILGR